MKKLLAVLITAFPCTVLAADNDVIEGAMGFMLGGDGGWDAVSQDYVVDGCQITYVQSYMGMKLKVTYDFDKANYKSATTEYRDNRTWFSVSGDKGIQDLSATENGEDVSAMLPVLGLMPGKTNVITFAIFVTEDRFLNAFMDLQAQCPGKKSKY